ncbi:MAG: cyclase family protein [Elusimicrobiales bacterium]|nr:cyclase family protein [Elusimicrobiales bacterium]MCK5106573.1 cyclase family protein [Elusimicrobiales bacterium]
MKSNDFMKLMNKVKMYDLTQPLSIHTPPWPSYMPLQLQYFKRIAGAHMGQGANGQIMTTSNHVGTHMDGEIHFYSAGRTIGNVPMEEWAGNAVVVDISKDVGDYDLYEPELLMKRADIRKGDILIINTGYSRYAWYEKSCDEVRYFCKHPGPGPKFYKWALDMKFKWIGVDCGSADHPMNTIIKDWHPKLFIEAEKKLIKKYNKNWEQMFPAKEYYQVMHIKLFPKGIVHAENLGGEIKKLSNKRCWVGCFPLKGIEMESSMCRIVAMTGANK